MELDRLDKIVLRDEKEINKLLAWKDNNKELVRYYKPVLDEGVITYGEYRQHFKQVDNKVSYVVWFGENKVMEFEIEHVGSGYVINRVWSVFGTTEQISYVEDAVTTHCSLMAYMDNYAEYVNERRERVVKKKSKGSSKSKKSNRVIKLGKKIYDVSVPESITTEKRVYNKHTDSFAVSGHTRTYKKTGKTIWIKPYVKGDKKAEMQPRTFKM